MEQDSLHAPNERVQFSHHLNVPGEPPRLVVQKEEARVEQLLDEARLDPYEGQPRFIQLGRNILARAGMVKLKPVETVERPWLKEVQASRSRSIEYSLEETRDAIRNSVIKGLDDKAVDEHLGLRSESSILPPLFQEMHAQAEAKQDEPLSFLGWMSDHASNEQLMNVWQWHDDHLNKLDTNPEFLEKVAEAKKAYMRGSLEAVDASELHVNMLPEQEDLDAISVVHASPFSPELSAVDAFVDLLTKRIYVQESTDEKALFHELTHGVKPGFTGALTEGPTEMITAAIYNRARPDADYALENSTYNNQIKYFKSLEHLTNGELDLLELSRLYASPESREMNTVLLFEKVSDSMGSSSVYHLFVDIKKTMNSAADKMLHADVARGGHLLMLKDIKVIEDLYFDKDGNKQPNDTVSLTLRLMDPTMVERHGKREVVTVLEALRKTYYSDLEMNNKYAEDGLPPPFNVGVLPGQE